MKGSAVETVIQKAKNNMLALLLRNCDFSLFYLCFGLAVLFLTDKNRQTFCIFFPLLYLRITIIMPLKVVKHDWQEKQTVASNDVSIEDVTPVSSEMFYFCFSTEGGGSGRALSIFIYVSGGQGRCFSICVSVN